MNQEVFPEIKSYQFRNKFILISSVKITSRKFRESTLFLKENVVYELDKQEDYLNFVEQQKLIIQNEWQGQQIANEGAVNLIIAALSNTDSQIRQNAETNLMLMRQTDVVLHTEDVLKVIAVSLSQQTLQYVIPYTLFLTKSLKQLKVFQEDQVLLKILSYVFVSLSNRNLNQKQTEILVSCLPYLLELSCSAQQP
ncbi:hypothetical protein ABPG72_016145, partial [Tetrahymena utriculariae]